MSEHTPGPWKAKMARTPSDGGFDWGIAANVAGRQACIAEAFEVVSINDRCPAEANARLIAAAPDLYAALEWMVEHDESGPGDEYHIAGLERAKAALEKARGKK